MEKQQERKPLPAHLLRQIEQCGWAAHLAETHREIAEDKHGARPVKQEIARAWAVRGQAELVDADAAVRWLMSEPGQVEQVGGHMDMVDTESGEVLASGNVGAVIVTPEGVLVVAWVVGERYNYPEPEEDLGLLAMGLAACKGGSFRVAHVYLQDGEAFPRRSPVFLPEAHGALLDRIRKAANTPRDRKCPGTWCTHCRVAPYCTAWLARAQAASVAMTTDLVLSDEGEVEAAPGFELTTENAAAFSERLELLGKVYDYANDLRDAYVRRGGVIMLGGKQLVMSPRAGRVTVTTSEFKPVLAKLDAMVERGESASHSELVLLATEFEATVKAGNPYEVPTWKKPEGIGGRR